MKEQNFLEIKNNPVKENNRDNTKYFVEYAEKGKWVPADRSFVRDKYYGKPLPKGLAACVFFTHWMCMHDKEFSLEEVRDAFPININSYYENSKRDFFDTLIYEMEAGVLNANLKREIINKAGKKIEEDSDKWDFYPVEPRKVNSVKCGYGYLKDGNIAVMPKIWRKDDFQSLLEHINTQPELFKGVRIRQA